MSCFCFGVVRSRQECFMCARAFVLQALGVDWRIVSGLGTENTIVQHHAAEAQTEAQRAACWTSCRQWAAPYGLSRPCALILSLMTWLYGAKAAQTTAHDTKCTSINGSF